MFREVDRVTMLNPTFLSTRWLPPSTKSSKSAGNGDLPSCSVKLHVPLLSRGYGGNYGVIPCHFLIVFLLCIISIWFGMNERVVVLGDGGWIGVLSCHLLQDPISNRYSSQDGFLGWRVGDPIFIKADRGYSILTGDLEFGRNDSWLGGFHFGILDSSLIGGEYHGQIGWWLTACLMTSNVCSFPSISLVAASQPVYDFFAGDKGDPKLAVVMNGLKQVLGFCFVGLAAIGHFWALSEFKPDFFFVWAWLDWVFMTQQFI